MLEKEKGIDAVISATPDHTHAVIALDTVAWASTDGVARSLQERIHQTVFASWLPPTVAAFAYALASVVLWWAVARWMDRRGIYLKV